MDPSMVNTLDDAFGKAVQCAEHYEISKDIFFFEQKTEYEVRISDWSSDVCASDLSICIRESSNAAKPHSYGESFSADGRLEPSRLPITIRAMPMQVATTRNSRVGRYSASTLASLGY